MQPISSSPESLVPAQDPFSSYFSSKTGFDESFGEEGILKPHWRSFLETLAALPFEEQARRQESLRRLVIENGIARGVFSDAGHPSPWSIDLIPILISPAEWTHLERGLIQRARLLDRIAKDLYGPQNLLKSGKVPPRLAFSDPAYLRACRPAGEDSHLINFLAADLIRDSSGGWRLIDIHAETPAGIGFALANRLLHGQVMADIFRAAHAVRLAPHFQNLQTELLRRIERDDPLIVLLTPGPQHEDYFSHAYLSRYLGFQLVEGGDLRVIGSRVYMKTLEGLKPIDLIIRCVEGRLCDPLELDPVGFAGPVGLVQALRKNQRLLINFLGSSIVQNRGLSPLLPSLCRSLAGEDLLLQDIPRRWLGDMEARVFVFAHLDRFVIRRASEGKGRPGGAQQGMVPSELSAKALEALKLELEINGQDYVAEERGAAAAAPSWGPDGFQARPFAMRLYAAAIDGDYSVMPGGLAMSLDGVGTAGAATASADGHSRDVWVLSESEFVSQVTLLRPPGEVAHVLRAGKGLRSRIADNLYCMGRYVERADWVMRLLRGALAQADDTNTAALGDGGSKALELILNKTQQQSSVPPEAAVQAPEEITRLLMSAQESAYSLPGIVSNVLRVGTAVRERLSLDLWQTLLRFSRIGSADIGEHTDRTELLERLNAGIITVAALNGLTAENMTRNFGWRFYDMGRRLERAYNLGELLLCLFGEARPEQEETSRLFFILNVADSTITFRQRYLFAPILSLVLDLLVIDETNPRGVGFQLAALSDHLVALPQASPHAPHNEEQRLMLDLLTRVRLAEVVKLAHREASADRPELKELLSHILRTLPKLSEAITRRYFNLTEDELRRVHARLGRRI